MGILWFGSEDIDFPNGNLPQVTASAGYYRSGPARCALGWNPTAGVARSVVFPGGAVTSCWVSVQFYDNPYGPIPTQYFLGLGKVGAPNALWFGSASTYYPRLSKTDGTTTTNLVDSTLSLFTNGVQKLDMQVTSFGAAATVNGYVNGVLAFTYTGDVRTTGMTDMDCVVLGGMNSYFTCYSEIIVADEDTRALGLIVYYPNAAGDTNDFTGAYTDIDETTLSDADLVYVNTNDKVCQVNLSATPAGAYAVKAVMISARCMKSSDATPTKMALGVKSGGSVDAGSDQALTTAWATYNRLMSVNPLTSNPWTTAELDALQLQLKSRA